MRSSTIFALALSVFGVSAIAVGKQSDQPACVTKCWANSQYVSNCAGSQQCLCDDAEFQNAMYQCLYSQCQTAQFGVALHHALALCSEDQAPSYTSVAPAMLRQGGDLRKRTLASQSNSVTYTRSTRTSVATTESTPTPSTYSSGRPSPSKSTRGSASVSASAYMTYSTSRANPTKAASVLSAGPSIVTVVNTVTYTAPASTSSTPADVIYVTVTTTASVTATPTAVVSQITDGQIQATGAAVAYSPADAAAIRQIWDTQRHPSNNAWIA